MSASRRRFLATAGTAAAAAAFRSDATRAADDGVTARLARYMAAAPDKALPDVQYV